MSDEQQEPADAAEQSEAIDFEKEPWQQPWMSRFLAGLSAIPNVTAAAKNAGITRQAAYLARQRDARFALGWRQATEEAIDHLERFSHNMATVGLEVVETRTTSKHKLNAKGELVEVERVTVEIKGRTVSPQMAMFLLQAHRPDKYRRPTRFEHTGPDGEAVHVQHISEIDAQITALSAELRARGGNEPVPVE